MIGTTKCNEIAHAAAELSAEKQITMLEAAKETCIKMNCDYDNIGARMQKYLIDKIYSAINEIYGISLDVQPMKINLISSTTGLRFEAIVISRTKCFATVQRTDKNYTMKLSLRTNRLVEDEFVFVSDKDIKKIKAKNIKL